MVRPRRRHHLNKQILVVFLVVELSLSLRQRRYQTGKEDPLLSSIVLPRMKLAELGRGNTELMMRHSSLRSTSGR